MLWMIIVVIAASAAGLVLSLVVVRKFAKGDAENGQRTSRIRTIGRAWTVAVFVLSWFAAFIIGGNFGGALGSQLAERMGWNETLLMVAGVGLGIFVCTALPSTVVGALAVALMRRGSARA
jgi:hypothetical protein